MNRTQMQTHLSAQECYRVLFSAYLEDRGVDSMELDRHYKALSKATQNLPFAQRDQIETATNAIRAAGEEQAFLDGMRTGICLICDSSSFRQSVDKKDFW